MSSLSSPSSKSNRSRKESEKRRVQDRSIPCLSPSRHLEVELWRRNQSITPGHSEPSISTSSHHPKILPSSLAAFNFNPQLSSPKPHDRPPAPTPRHANYRPDPACPDDLDRLRLHALTELQRSVVETGEDFVDKMRNWETLREREAMAHRGLKRSRSMMARTTSDPVDDSDDIMILGSTPADEEANPRQPRKKRALSVDLMDGLDPALSEATPSATTDDDSESCGRDSTGAPSISHAPLYPDTPSSNLDKAVSALTLAFANGACGINDYQSVLDAYNHTHYGEESHVGELWN